MITKIRTNIFLTKGQQKKLRGLSKKTGAPVAVHVRRAIDEYFGRFERKEKSKSCNSRCQESLEGVGR